MIKVKAIKELEFGDKLQLSSGPYMTATVKRVTRDEVVAVRPYAIAKEDSGNVLFGFEEIRYLVDSDLKVNVVNF